MQREFPRALFKKLIGAPKQRIRRILRADEGIQRINRGKSSAAMTAFQLAAAVVETNYQGSSADRAILQKAILRLLLRFQRIRFFAFYFGGLFFRESRCRMHDVSSLSNKTRTHYGGFEVIVLCILRF
jgi:hypothetical protein